MKANLFHRLTGQAAFWILTGVVIAAMVAGCRRGMPVIDTTPGPAQADGTISGTVRGPENTSAVEGRRVEAVNIETGERHQAVTNNAGGFTMKVPPGRYRVELALLEGEVLVKRPGVINVNRSDVDAHADFVLGSSRLSYPRAPRPSPAGHGLGAPIA